MTPICPLCHSLRVVSRDYARKAGGTIGAVAGAASSLGAALKGARTGGWLGGQIGIVAGPTGTTLGAIAGAILGALAGGAVGCSAGSALGELIDDKILANFRCLHCDHTFAHTSDKRDSDSWHSPDESDAPSFGHQGFDPLRAD